MPSQPRSTRYRITFKKTDGMRFTGTLDLHRTLERTMRRAGLEMTYTQGFNPRPRLSLGAALPLGLTSDCELADIWLEASAEEGKILDELRQAKPPGLEFLDLDRVPEEEASLQQQITAAEYLAELRPGAAGQQIQERVDALLAKQSLPRERRGKPYDLRPLIAALEIESGPSDSLALRMRLASREGATGRPDEVLLALGLDPSLARVCRTRLLLSSPILSG